MEENKNNKLHGETQNQIEELKKLGYNIFSLPIESMEIERSIPDDPKFKYYTLYRYLRHAVDGMDIAPISYVRVKTRFTGIPYDFLVGVDIEFSEPQRIDQQLIETIEKTNDPSLCNVQYNIYEINKILDLDGKRIDYQLFPSQAQEQMEFTSKSDKDRETLKGLIEFRHTIQKYIVDTPDIAKSIAMRYNEVLKAIAHGDILDKKEYVALISQLYDDKDLLQESLEGAKHLKETKERLYRESNTSNEAIIRLLEKDMLAFNDAYKDQGAGLYNNVLKGGAYSELYREEIDMIKKHKDMFKKYMGALHIGFGCGDMSKEVELYKQILGIKYIDEKDMYSGLDKDNPDIRQFRESHCFVGVDTSKMYEDKIQELHLMGFGHSFDNFTRYFFDHENSFFVNRDIYAFLEDKNIVSKNKGNKAKSIEPNHFNSASFDILGNTLLNFNEEERIHLIDTFMNQLGEKTVGFVSIHQRNMGDMMLKLYNTPQERARLENLIKTNYGIEKKVKGKDIYELNFSMSEQGNVQITMKLLEDAKFIVGEKEIIKQKGTMLNVGDSGKSSDQEFRELIERTHKAKIIDSIESDSGRSKIYIIGHKNYDMPTEGAKNYEKIFDEGYLEVVQKEKANLSRIFSYPMGDFKPYYNSWGIENELKKGEITLVLDKEFLPTKYSNSPSGIVIKIGYNNKSFESIADLLHMAGESPSIIDVRYLDFGTKHQKYNTLNKGENGYTMWVDDPHHPEIGSHAMSVENDLQKKAETFCKNILLHTVKRKI